MGLTLTTVELLTKYSLTFKGANMSKTLILKFSKFL